jgi:release factor glutamine methyltransferase
MELSAVAARLRAAGSVFAEDEARLLADAAPSPDALAVMVEQRVAGLPIEHVVGWAELGGRRVAVDPMVFVPRRRTEHLVEQALALTPSPAIVVDLCCGSGAIGAALAGAVGGVELHAVDIDPNALESARRNLAPLGGRAYLGDLFQPLPPELAGRVEVIVANTPYVPSGAIRLLPGEARLHEPLVALDGGADGLDVHRRVAAEAPRWLAAGGHLLVEASAGQAAESAAIFERNGLAALVSTCDELEATVIIGTRPAVSR